MPQNRSDRPDSTRRGAAEFLRSYEARQKRTAPEEKTSPLTALSVAQALQKERVAYEALKNSAASDALGKDKVYLEIVTKSATNQPVHPLLSAHVCRLETTQEAFALDNLSDAFASGHNSYFRSTVNHREGTGYSNNSDNPVSSWYIDRKQR